MSQSNRPSDDDLLAAIREGDGDAFAILYRRYLPSVLAFVLRETGDRELAADVTSEVFAAILLAAGRYRLGESEVAAPWVFGIARNKVRLTLRRQRAEDRARRKLGWEPDLVDDEDLRRVDELAEEGRRALDLLETLPRDQRIAVRKHVIEGASYSDLARQLNSSEALIRQRVSRGLRRLRHHISEVSHE